MSVQLTVCVIECSEVLLSSVASLSILWFPPIGKNRRFYALYDDYYCSIIQEI